jgi:hypothetical protein
MADTGHDIAVGGPIGVFSCERGRPIMQAICQSRRQRMLRKLVEIGIDRIPLIAMSHVVFSSV